MHVTRRAATALLSATVLAVVLGACGGDGGTTTTTTASTLLPATTATTNPATTAATTGGVAASVPPSAATAQLTDVAATAVGGKDELAFTFANGLPGYRVETVAKAITDGEGKEVSVNGTKLVQVTFVYATAWDQSKNAPTYGGPARFSPPGTNVVSEVVRTGDFEGHLTWVTGLRSDQPFHVEKRTGPDRVVIVFG